MKIGLTAILFIFMPTLLLSQAEGISFANESLLNSGKWHKLSITSPGVYRLDYTKLTEMGFTNPSNVKVFGNNSGQLSYYNNMPQPDDLFEVASVMNKGTDEVFNEGDFILFYAEGTHRWQYNESTERYSFKRHYYSDTSVYFITEMPGTAKTVFLSPVTVSEPDYVTNAYDALFIKEDETENIIKSGREWYQPVSVLKGIAIQPGFSGLINDEPILYKIRVVGRSSVPSMFRILSEGETAVSIMVPEVNMYNTTGTFARYAESEGTLPHSDSPAYEVWFYNNGEPGARGWLDYVWLQGRAELATESQTIVFSDSRSTGPDVVNEYRIRTSDPALVVWDVTDPVNPSLVQTSYNGTFLWFRATADSLKRYTAFKPANLPAPQADLNSIPNQNLHGTGPCDMLIITHPLFMSQAQRLSDLHNLNSGLNVSIVTPQQIYNEFSGGIPDISAIRNFVRMMYLKHEESGNPLKYLLLFGDGSYDNKSLPPANPNFIPTWQTENSNIIVSSFMSDDFYGLLDENEGEAAGFLDIGIGRLPAFDTASAKTLVDKIDIYLNGSDPGTWRNIITMVADDEDGNLHMNDAENLANLLSSVHPVANIEKIYFDVFRQVTSVNGQSYPDVTRAINNRINQGTLIFNYLGHGNEQGLAHERVVKTADINSWNNLTKLPLFITATCEFSRFDDVTYDPITGVRAPKTSAGEMVLLNPAGGAIALMSTTRVVFSAPNFILNRNIYNYAFGTDPEGQPLRLGDIIRLAKINSGSGNNKRNFSLLGDPALRLAVPSNGVIITDSLNNKQVSVAVDTLKALSEISLSGHIEDVDGSLMSEFSGVMNVTVYDKPVKVTTLANDGGLKMDYLSMNSILFSGKTTIEKGRFNVSFMVPRDIDYNFGTGKISYYAHDGIKHASGYFDDLVVGGFSANTVTDTTGPLIRLFLNDTLFRTGGISGSKPVLIAIVSDTNGINTTGAGIGHDLVLWINGDRNSSIVVNNYFEFDFDNFRKGTVSFPLGEFEPGQATVTLKAWDNYNNSAEETLWFVVGNDIKFMISDILNFPNPFTSSTAITAGHNRPEGDIDVEVSIFNMSGKKIRTIRTISPGGGFNITPVEWDRTSSDGSLVGSGIYIYRITIRTDGNEITQGSGRMIIM